MCTHIEYFTSHTHTFLACAPWFRHAHIISHRCSITDDIFSRTHCHLYAQILHAHTHVCWEVTLTDTHTHTHAERAFLRCSVRLSLALILISRKGKSLLGAVGAWGESSVFSVTHSNTETACYWLFVNDSFQLNYAIISYLRFDIIQSSCPCGFMEKTNFSWIRAQTSIFTAQDVDTDNISEDTYLFLSVSACFIL